MREGTWAVVTCPCRAGSGSEQCRHRRWFRHNLTQVFRAPVTGLGDPQRAAAQLPHESWVHSQAHTAQVGLQLRGTPVYDVALDTFHSSD